MRSILATANRTVLRQFAWANVLVAFDFDGTLAPIVRRPERAAMRPATRRLLGALARRYPCVVISGRAHADVARRLQDVAVRAVVGNHGLDPWRATSRLANLVRRWRPVLDAHLDGLRGVEVEDKTFSVAIHYRRSREKKKVRAAILRAAGALGPVRLIGGKQVVNVLPDGAPHKGHALERERERFGCDTAIYVGDDETDEDVFVLDEPGQLLAIRVGRERVSSASYCIASQREIDDLLQLMLRLRSEPRRAGLAPRGP